MNNELLFLNREAVEACNFPLTAIIETISTLFAEKGEGKIEMPPKPGVHPVTDASIRAMLAYIPSMDAAGVKWISGYGRNFEKGLPNIQGLIILNDTETGTPLALMDCTWITAQRTAAATAVAAKFLARPDSKQVGILACGGEQGRANFQALASVFSLKRVVGYDISVERAELFKEHMSSEFPEIEIVVANSAEEAVQEMDIVVTAGPILTSPEPVIKPDWLKAGSFTCTLDFDAYVTPEAFQDVDKLVTDDFDQFHYFQSTGYFKKTPEPTIDLGAVACGRVSGRTSDEERIISLNLGIAMHDISTASLIYQQAMQQGKGIRLTL